MSELNKRFKLIDNDGNIVIETGSFGNIGRELLKGFDKIYGDGKGNPRVEEIDGKFSVPVTSMTTSRTLLDDYNRFYSYI